MAETPSQSGTNGEESEKQRIDRNFAELLQAARVAVTGVQVLFAFLLTVPFSERFEDVTSVGHWLFYVALVGAAIASVCYITPAAQHRILFRQGLKDQLVRRSNHYAIAGGAALAVSMTAATLLVTDFLFHNWLAVATAGVIALFAAWAWFVQPAIARRNGR